MVFHGNTYSMGTYPMLTVFAPVRGRMRQVFDAAIGGSHDMMYGKSGRSVLGGVAVILCLQARPRHYLDLHLERRLLSDRRVLLDPREGPLSDELTADGRVPTTWSTASTAICSVPSWQTSACRARAIGKGWRDSARCRSLTTAAGKLARCATVHRHVRPRLSVSTDGRDRVPSTGTGSDGKRASARPAASARRRLRNPARPGYSRPQRTAGRQSISLVRDAVHRLSPPKSHQLPQSRDPCSTTRSGCRPCPAAGRKSGGLRSPGRSAACCGPGGSVGRTGRRRRARGWRTSGCALALARNRPGPAAQFPGRNTLQFGHGGANASLATWTGSAQA